MMSNRYTVGQSSAIRKSRLEGKPSLLPKPRRTGSTDRLSSEPRRPSAAGHRSSSAEPARGTFGTSLSREASATKLSVNRRSHSQTVESRYSQATTTPLRTGHYRTTTTPVRTPSEDRINRSWEASLERALAFVTIKDQRPISSVAWQRSEYARVTEGLAARGDTSSLALIRPLTIARFVDTVSVLLSSITRDAKLNSDNYVTKLPHLTKRVLYPGAVSKTWLRTVNTLHAFPHALALVSYLLDLVTHVETPVLDEFLYLGKDDLGCLRRDYLYKCWVRFQDPGTRFEDLNEDYLQNLKRLLGNDDERIAALEQTVQKYTSVLEDEAEAAARADEARRESRRAALAAAARAARAQRHDARATAAARRAAATDARQQARLLDADLERLTAESERVSAELAAQGMTREERARVLDDLDYTMRVHDSKSALTDEIRKMVSGKETELALWQKKTLESCAEYRQRLIHLSGLPALAALAVDEKSLMGAECVAFLCRAVDTLRDESGRLAARRSELARSRGALARKRAAMMEEARAGIAELQGSVEREQAALEAERARDAEGARAALRREADLRQRRAQLHERAPHHRRQREHLQRWEQRDRAWRTKLAEMREYIEKQKVAMQRALDAARDKRVDLVANSIRQWNEKLTN